MEAKIYELIELQEQYESQVKEKDAAPDPIANDHLGGNVPNGGAKHCTLVVKDVSIQSVKETLTLSRPAPLN